MKKLLIKKGFICTVFAVHCFLLFAWQAEAMENYEEGIYYAAVDRLSLRNAPGLQSSKELFVMEGEVLRATGTVSERTDEVTLRGKHYNEPWVEIVYRNSKYWVYGGALTQKAPAVSSRHWRVLIIYDPLDLEDEDNFSEDWSYFSGSIGTSCSRQAIIVVSNGYGVKKIKVEQGFGNSDPVLITTVDLDKMLPEKNKNDRGYLIIEKGKKPRFVVHDLPGDALKQIENYFGFPILQI